MTAHTEGTQTSRTLLERVRDTGDQGAWNELVRRYRPVICSAAQRCGLNESDVDDVAQDVLASLLIALPELRYDRTKGRFRGYLHTATRRRVIDHLRTSTKSEHTIHPDLVAQQATAEFDESWESEWTRVTMRAALQRTGTEVSPIAFQAFQLSEVEGVPIAEISRALGLTRTAAYRAISRVRARMRENVRVMMNT
jgi:RNA polymerase sigma factor (sigma-70 family)